ncbi:MAG: anthranilate synthase component I [candidate division KSB1 bacterium]|nr:anthranilate synthase component I [candidate division KSB1 bacterium]
MIRTTFAEFDRAASAMPLTPILAEVPGDLDTALSTFIKITRNPYRFLLESAESGGNRGRYSIIGDSPFLIFKSRGRQITLQNCLDNTHVDLEDDPFDVLQNLLRKYARRAHSAPFACNGLFGYWGYDAVRHIEKLPVKAVADLDLPDIHLFIPQRLVVFDNLLHKITLMLFTRVTTTTLQAYESAVEELKEIERQIRRPYAHEIPAQPTEKPSVESNLTRNEFEKRVVTAKQHIAAGDVFQLVLSQRLKILSPLPALQVYRGLRMINPSPYMFFLELGDLEILGSSPETLVKLTDGEVTVKPIAGTIRRGQDEAEDQRLIQTLMDDPKERAEHLMLVDLGRNDIGRIAEFGSVRVEDFMTVEKYSHVIHLVSTVKGKLAGDRDAVDVFKACFPAGTLTGAPKVRAMELIEELEPTRRAVYGGAVGYMRFDGDMDVCIAIRTILKKAGVFYLQAGAGVVADSVPEHEYQETLNKAQGLLKALELANGGL